LTGGSRRGEERGKDVGPPRGDRECLRRSLNNGRRAKCVHYTKGYQETWLSYQQKKIDKKIRQNGQSKERKTTKRVTNDAQSTPLRNDVQKKGEGEEISSKTPRESRKSNVRKKRTRGRERPTRRVPFQRGKSDTEKGLREDYLSERSCSELRGKGGPEQVNFHFWR